jgi:hypothetical protein
MKKTVDKIPFYRLGWNKKYCTLYCVKGLILFFSKIIIISDICVISQCSDKLVSHSASPGRVITDPDPNNLS